MMVENIVRMDTTIVYVYKCTAHTIRTPPNSSEKLPLSAEFIFSRRRGRWSWSLLLSATSSSSSRPFYAIRRNTQYGYGEDGNGVCERKTARACVCVRVLRLLRLVASLWAKRTIFELCMHGCVCVWGKRRRTHSGYFDGKCFWLLIQNRTCICGTAIGWK